jgi:XTP/dITP diphosphohydrolase
MKILFATHNQNKLREIKSLLGTSFYIISLIELKDTTDVEETGQTFEDNALIKAKHFAKKHNMPCFADDSGLEVMALNNAPGVYSARYAGTPKDDKNNLNLLLHNMQGSKNRAAHFTTCICFIDEAFQSHFFSGKLLGNISLEPIGNNGFGYDPIFIPEGYEITLAQMSLTEKNSISHRAIAFNQFCNFLKNR